MTEVTPAGRSDAVQLLRQATDARLKKPSAPQRSQLRRSRSFNAYPGFIPDPEVLERQELLRKQSSSSLRSQDESPTSSPAQPPAPPQQTNAPPPSSKPRAQVAFRKSGLPTKKTLAQRRSRAVPGKPSHRNSKSYGPPRKFAPARQPAPILKTDPLGFLANRFDKAGDQPTDLTSQLNKINPRRPVDPNQRQQLRRSRSFNAVPDHGRTRVPGSPLTPFSGAHPKNSNGTVLYRSKSQRQVPKNKAADNLDLLGVPFNNMVQSSSQATPAVGLRRWLSVGRKTPAMPNTQEPPPRSPITQDRPRKDSTSSPDDSKPLPPLPPKPLSKANSVKNLGRMRSLRWMGKKKPLDKIPEGNAMTQTTSEGSGRTNGAPAPELLTRSRTTRDRATEKSPKLNRSNTTRAGNGEIMRSLKNFFDGLSLKPRGNHSPEIQLVGSPEALDSVKRPVVQNPELSLKNLVIQDSATNSLSDPPAGEDSKPFNGTRNHHGLTINQNVITPNLADANVDYFAIPVKSSRRPSKDTGSYLRGTELTILDDRSFSAHPPVNQGQGYQMEYAESPFPVHPQVSQGATFARAEFHENFQNALPTTVEETIPPSPLAHQGPSYQLVFDGPVKQIMDSTTIRDRHLFLFDHILVVTKLVPKSNSPESPEYSITKVIWVDAINEVTQRHASPVATPVEDPSVPALPRKYVPVLMATIRRFEIEPASAIAYLVGRGAVKPDPTSIARLLHNTPELDRRMLGRFLALDKSCDVLEAFLSRFHWHGLRLDLALRTLLSALRLPTNRDNGMVIIERAAHHWHTSNRNVLPLPCIAPLMLCMLQLSKIKPGSPSFQEFLDSCHDSSPSIQDGVLKSIYDSVLDSPLVECSDQLKLPIGVGGRPTSRFIQNEKSDPIWVKIPTTDANLQLSLYGAGITCDPPVLDFASSDTQWFTVTGSIVGRLSLMLIPMGPSAGNYEFLPAKTFVVEPAFMKHTLALSFPTSDISASSHEDIVLASPALTKQSPQCRKRYLFGMSDASELAQWTEHLENTIDMYQETLDEWAEQLDEEHADNSTWAAQAEDTSHIRHQTLATSAIRHFQPLLGRSLTRPDLITFAGHVPEGVPPPPASRS